MVCKKIKSHMCFELTEEDVVSCSRVIQIGRVKMPTEEERNLIHNGTQINTCRNLWFFFWDRKMVGKTIKVAMSHSTWKMDRF